MAASDVQGSFDPGWRFERGQFLTLARVFQVYDGDVFDPQIG